MAFKIVFIGAPSTGKSTLCAALAEKLNGHTVDEYGREYWLAHQVDRRLSPEQLLHIAQTQNHWEDQAEKAGHDPILCDTSAFTTWHFAMHYHGSALPALDKLARQSWQRYDLVVLCDNDIPYDDTWERSGDANRTEFQQFNKDYLAEYDIAYVSATGSVADRVTKVCKAIEQCTASSH